MFDSFLTKIFGSRNDRLIRQYRKRCAQINKLEPEIQALTDEQLRGKTAEFRERLDKGETLDALLPEAFAVVREASRRVLGMRHFDVQLIGGMVLNDGKIAEMRTGEGKTLTATLAVYLNALPAKGVHVVTVNDYLASRDAAWMGRLYNFLGMTVGTILSQQDTESKKAAYAADITYGTNNEFGFDYLRDNMEYEVANRRQRPLAYAIVDEVDSILIDEARTPLIISGAADDNTDLYKAVNEIPPLLTRQAEEKGEGDYWVDEKATSKMKPTLVAVFMKLVGFCAVFLPVAAVLGFRNEELIAILVMLGSATTVSCFVMARNMGHKGTLSSGVIMMTTLLSAFTLTMWLDVLRSFGLCKKNKNRSS